jgi:hypothetical protein
MGAKGSITPNVRLRKEMAVGKHGKVLGCYVNTMPLRIIGVCSKCVEIFNVYTGNRMEVYNTEGEILCTAYDKSSQTVIIGETKGNVKLLSAINLSVFLQMAVGMTAINIGISSILKVDTVLYIGLSIGVIKKISYTGKELASFQSIMENKKVELLENANDSILGYPHVSLYAPIKYLKFDNKANKLIVSYYHIYKNTDNKIAQLTTNYIAVYDNSNGQLIGEMATSINAVNAMELLITKGYCATIEGTDNTLYLYDYANAMKPLLKFNLDISQLMKDSTAISMQIIPNNQAILETHQTSVQLPGTEYFIMIGFNDGKILSSTYSITTNSENKIEMEWTPQFLFSHKLPSNSQVKNGYDPLYFGISTLYLDPLLDVCLGGDQDGNILVAQKAVSGMLSKSRSVSIPDKSFISSAKDILRKIKNGIPSVLSRLSSKMRSAVIRKPEDEVEMQQSVEVNKKEMSPTIGEIGIEIGSNEMKSNKQ